MNRRPRKQQNRRPQPKVDKTPFQLTITGLTHDGRGVGRVDGKAIFVRQALPGETVEAVRTQSHSKFDEGEIAQLIDTSQDRVTPPCEHYGECGGCELQHLSAPAQVNFKQEHLLSQLARIGKCTPEHIDPAISHKTQAYRRSARVGVNQRAKDASLLLGFRRHNSNKLMNVNSCYVLEDSLNEFIKALRPILEDYAHIRDISHIQLSRLDHQGAAILRTIKPLKAEVLQQIQCLCEAHQLTLYIVDGDKITASLAHVDDEKPSLQYLIDEDVRISVSPGDFFQVNAQVNESLIAKAIEWLELSDQDHVLDLFCGAGNFSLPLAKRAKAVTGIEGVAALVKAAQHNAQTNELSNCEFYQADLTTDLRKTDWYNQPFNKILLDPPRAGAAEVVADISQYGAVSILYVSCNPAALARDTQILQAQGYSMERFAIANMFPHTAHIESIALFVKSKNKKKVKSAHV